MTSLPEENKKSLWSWFIIWYRKDIWPLLNESKYPLLFIFWIAVVIIGYIGFSQLHPSNSAPDDLYLTMQIFVMPAGNFQGSPNLFLTIARIGAMILLYISFIALVAHSFYEQLELLQLRFLTRDHVVVCGLGNIGSIVIRNSLSTRAASIVVIEADPAHKEVAWCRSNGITVVIGNATDRRSLEQAGIKSAQAIYVTTGSDEVNTKVIAQIHNMIQERKVPLNCYVHIIDPNFANLLRAPQLAVSGVTPVSLEFFNIFQIANFCVLECVPDLIPLTPAPPDRHILIIGLGRMGEGLLIELAKRWQQSYGGKTEKRIRITVIDRNAARKKALLESRYTSLSEYCEIIPCSIDVLSPEFYQSHYLEDTGRKNSLNAIFICLSDESLNFSTGLYLNQKLQDSAIPIIIRTVHSTGLAHFFNQICAKHTDEYKNIHAFPLVSCSCCIESLVGMNELIALSIHRHYLLMRTREGALPGSDPAMKPWRSLDTEYKESCRSQASHIKSALHSCGYSIIARTDWDEPLTVFSEGEVEKMGEMEHDRWWAERARRGWTSGPRDLEKKTSPYLIPYDQLDERTKGYDRDFVRLYPEILTMADLSIKCTTRDYGDTSCLPAVTWSCSSDKRS
jgi:hypothetical protein